MEQRTSCGGNCAGCARSGNCGAAGALYLTEKEIALLRRFGEIPFWPVARRADSEEPVCLEEGGMDAQSLAALGQKGLIRLDFDLPLSRFDYRAYAACPHQGSMALTALGQRALELLEIQGVQPL